MGWPSPGRIVNSQASIGSGTQPKKVIIPLALGIALLFGILLSQSSFDQPAFLNPDNNQQLSVLRGAFRADLPAVCGPDVCPVPQLAEAFCGAAAGRAGLEVPHPPGGHGLLLSFLPVIVMFWFAYGLMNRTIDRWFSRPVEEVREDTRAMASLLAHLRAAERRSRGGVDRRLSPEAQRAFPDQHFSAHESRVPAALNHAARRIRVCPARWQRRSELPCSRTVDVRCDQRPP